MKTLILLLGLLLVSGCVSSEYIECPEESDAFCIEIYEPVCGEDGEEYSNGCFACQKVNKYRNGEC